ncbi:hypothetical protein RMSM_06657 [Rhodopirellula maiorica SM1]|uniref:Thymidylate kinase-like domain-containing protein n=2 Tax=Novipirellula TaxID=2795426 RepID=M5RR28_9BACT|nr:hypothetical protein RMSM_06657 [Rhodopirellula maiorica SM1]
MGVNHEASEHLLPTTRLVQALRQLVGRKKYAGGPREKHSDAPVKHKSMPRRIWKTAKSSVSLTNRLAEEWYRQLVAWYHLKRKRIVIFDRHFFPDYYAYDIVSDAPRSVTQKVHGYMLNRFYPRPDVIVFLDAPAEVLFDRKGEGTLELLEERRNDYLQMKDLVKHFEIVDASRSIDDVVDDVSERITRYYEQQSQKSQRILV